MHWLKVIIKDGSEGRSKKWPPAQRKVYIELQQTSVAPLVKESHTFRISPIFALDPKTKVTSVANTTIHFISVDQAFQILARIESIGSDELKKSVFFSCGLTSIILISKKQSIASELKKIIGTGFYASEIWQCTKGEVKEISYTIRDTTQQVFSVSVPPYGMLSVTERSTVDEFVSSMQLVLIKLNSHMPAELDKMKKLIKEMSGLVTEIVFLTNFKGKIPGSFAGYTKTELQDKTLNHILKQQNLDRIVQVSSALAYVSTQAFSGATPILERRSLIRRHSFLGVGSAISALNNISKFIQDCFNKVNFVDIITDAMQHSAPLQGMKKIQEYSISKWGEASIDNFTSKKEEIHYYKLPYFSGRLGYRETEYSIAASMQSIVGGGSLEWTLMTLTHEMLHGHVRTLLGAIMDSGKVKPEKFRTAVFQKFVQNMNGKTTGAHLIDSLRQIIFYYCCLTKTHGSIATKSIKTTGKVKLFNVTENELWNILESENRNISEIFVHVLDLHYFYGSSIAVYLPLIWSSWVSVPHIKGDLRQYILRSLLAIASVEAAGSTDGRFKTAVSIMIEQLEKYKNSKLNHSTIHRVLEILDDHDRLQTYYYLSFEGSVIIVDMIMKIFHSKKVRSAILNDLNIEMLMEDDTSKEISQTMRYNLPTGFQDEIIKSPVAFLLDRMTRILTSDNVPDNEIEKNTTMQFLALFSHLQNR